MQRSIFTKIQKNKVDVNKRVFCLSVFSTCFISPIFTKTSWFSSRLVSTCKSHKGPYIHLGYTRKCHIILKYNLISQSVSSKYDRFDILYSCMLSQSLHKLNKSTFYNFLDFSKMHMLITTHNFFFPTNSFQCLNPFIS